MKPFLLVLGLVLLAVVLAALAAYAWGTRLPREHVARGSIVVEASPAAVGQRIFDVATQPAWRSSASRIEILDQQPDAITYREHQGSDAITYRLRAFAPGTRYESTILDDTLPFGGRWTFALAPHPGSGTEVTITEHGFVDPPLFRVLAKDAFGHERTLRDYLQALQASFAPAALEAVGAERSEGKENDGS